MHKKLLAILLSLSIFVACQQQKSSDESDEKPTNEEVAPYSLVPLWESDSNLTTAESVIFDSSRNKLFVSCINGVPPTAQDGDGFIAMVDAETGRVDDLLFISLLDAPKGMALIGDLLYVTNINEIVEISVNDAVIINRWEIDSAEFLNDMAIGADQTVYFSDSNTGNIYQLKDGEISGYMDLGSKVGPNGLFIDGSMMYVAGYADGNLHVINMETKEIKMITDGIGAGDGIAPMFDGLLVSNWNGEVYMAEMDGSKVKLLDTKGSANAADIYTIPETSTLLVPTFFNNTVKAYKVRKNDQSL